MRLSRHVLVAALLLSAWGLVSAGALVPGDEESPEWIVSEWINGDPGMLSSHKGRVLVLHFFQMWCPGCNEFSIPVMKRWETMFGDREDFMIVSIHSVFEGHDYQTTERLRKFLRRNGIWHPVGVDAYEGADAEVPITMKRFQASGTPQLAVIDKTGLLIFSHFGEFDIATMEFLLERLLKEESEEKPPAKPQVGRDAKISGTYKMQFLQSSKSCGDLAAEVTVNVKLDVITDFIEVSSPREFLGQSTLTASYNSRTLRFNAVANDVRQIEGAEVKTYLTVMGHFVQGSKPPQLEFDVMFNQRSDRADLLCTIKARGMGGRIGD